MNEFPPFFMRRNGELFVEERSLSALAEEYGTPLYIYSARTLDQRLALYREALAEQSHQLHFSVKANGNLAVLARFAAAGIGFDVVSEGELGRVLAAGASPADVVFSGVGKTDAELSAAVALGVGCVNLESEEELERLMEIAATADRRIPVSVRINPNIAADTHPHIATGLAKDKFGVPPEQALAMYRRAAENERLVVRGIACHIGSQLDDPAPLLEALDVLLGLRETLAAEGLAIEHLDLGGGAGVDYGDGQSMDIPALCAAVRRRLADSGLKLLLEPGRSMCAAAGILLTRVVRRKNNGGERFLITDAGLNDLLRPALYGARHPITEVRPNPEEPARNYAVVGPICESADELGRDLRPACRQRRPACHRHGRRLRLQHELQLQRASALRRTADRRRCRPSRAQTRTHGGSVARRESAVMKREFAKMNGAGNDFIVIEALSEHFDPELDYLRRIADRDRGVGCDQILIIDPPRDDNADFECRIFNADGSEAEQCGNGMRCIGRYALDRGLACGPPCQIQLPGRHYRRRTRCRQLRMDGGRYGNSSIRPRLHPLHWPRR